MKEAVLRDMDKMSREEALKRYDITYYTVEELMELPDIGEEIRKMYTQNYM